MTEYVLQSTPKVRGVKEDTAQVPTLLPEWDRCQWVGSWGRCLLRATRDSWFEAERTRYKFCPWHSDCGKLGWNARDFDSFDSWRASLPRLSWWTRYTAGSVFDLVQGKLVQLTHAQGHRAWSPDPGRMLSQDGNQRRLRQLIDGLSRERATR